MGVALHVIRVLSRSLPWMSFPSRHYRLYCDSKHYTSLHQCHLSEVKSQFSVCPLQPLIMLRMASLEQLDAIEVLFAASKTREIHVRDEDWETSSLIPSGNCATRSMWSYSASRGNWRLLQAITPLFPIPNNSCFIHNLRIFCALLWWGNSRYHNMWFRPQYILHLESRKLS